MLSLRHGRKILAVLEQRKTLFDLTGLRKTPRVFFGEQQLSVGENVKLTAAAFGDFNLIAKARLD